MMVSPDDGRLLGHVLLDAVLAEEPGPQLDLLLDAIPVPSLNDAQKAQLVQAWERQLAWAVARRREAVGSLDAYSDLAPTETVTTVRLFHPLAGRFRPVT